MKLYQRSISLVLAILSLSFALGAAAQNYPSGRDISVDEVLLLFQSLGGFLFTLGGILAVIVIIISGIMYFTAGGNQQKLSTAKKILVGGMLGALIIFGSGVIIGTIKGFAVDPLQFFR
jgi:type IV secretory pathway VirB2 component (pilin)